MSSSNQLLGEVIKLVDLEIPNGSRVLFGICSDDRFLVNQIMAIDHASRVNGWTKHLIASPGTALGLADDSIFSTRELISRAVDIFHPNFFIGITHIGVGYVEGCYAAKQVHLDDIENISIARRGMEFVESYFNIPAVSLILLPHGSKNMGYRFKTIL